MSDDPFRTNTPPAPEPAEKIYPLSTLRGRCPSCGEKPYTQSDKHMHTVREADRRLDVTCSAKRNHNSAVGCGRRWIAESASESDAAPDERLYRGALIACGFGMGLALSGILHAILP